MSIRATIGFDYSHNNKLTLEGSGYADFTQFLFSSSFQLGKIQAGFDSLQKIKRYDVLILSSPMNSVLKPVEIEVLENYVREGGSLLIINSGGGDYTNNTNLNELTNKFGFEFVSDEIFDSMNYVYLQKRLLLTKFTPHLITEGLKKVVFSSACSLKALDFIEDEKNIKIEKIINAGLNCWRKRYDGNEWIEEDSPKTPLLVAVEYFNGKVVAFGCHTIFSSFGREYGFAAFDNDVLIANILRWLTAGIYSENGIQGKVINVNLNMDLYYWVEHIVKDKNWESVSDIINVSMKYFKDNYEEIIEEITTKQLEKLRKKKELEEERKEKIEESGEEKILDVVLNRQKKDLLDIISELELITGEKYELSIDLDLEEEAELLDQKLIKIDELQAEELDEKATSELEAEEEQITKTEEDITQAEILVEEEELEDSETMLKAEEQLTQEDEILEKEEEIKPIEEIIIEVKEEKTNYQKWSIQKLRHFCKEHQIKITAKSRKKDIIKILESYEKEQNISEK